MTREEAARVLTELADEYERYELSKNGWLGTTYIPAHRMGAEALRGPVPDPETGLVPCGCGGKAKVWCLGPAVPTQFTPVVSVYEVGCTECAITTRRVSGKQENAVKAWNTAMGWKGGAAMQRVDVAPGFDSIRPEMADITREEAARVLTEEQVRVLEALYEVFDFKWLAKQKDGQVMAYANRPNKSDDWYGCWFSGEGDNEEDYGWKVKASSPVCGLISWSDPAPLDIVQTLQENGIEIEEETP